MEFMKSGRTKHRFSLASMATVAIVALAAVLAASGFTSCTKSDPELNPEPSSAIILSANVLAMTESRAAVSGTTFPASTPNVFCLTAFSGATAPTVNWNATPYFNNIPVNSGTASALTLETAQYYPVNGDNVFFYGYAPVTASLTAGTASSAPTANYTITGQDDIMAAQVTTGIAKATTGTQPQPTLAFTHKLMQVRFKIVKDASFEADKKVTNISVNGVKTSAKLNIATGALTFDGAANQTLSLPITPGTTDEITPAGTEMVGCVMLEPAGTGGSIMLTVTANGVTYNNITVALTGTNHGEAGTNHPITLTFKRTGITPSAAIIDWATPVDTDVDVDFPPLPPLPPLAPIGDYIDGGIVYWTDATKYKVMSLTQSEEAYWWSAKTGYVVGSAGQSYANGKANVAAMKAYSLANIGNSDLTNKTTGIFATDFPAAGFCDIMGDGWYLPALNELKALYDAYQIEDNKIAINAGLTKYGGVAFPASGKFWSSTEYSINTSTAWYINFSYGNMPSSFKSGSYSVRCVRDS